MKNEKEKLNIYMSLLALIVFTIIIVGATSLFPSKSNKGVVIKTEVILPVVVSDLGAQMVKEGVIDDKKFIALYSVNKELEKEARELLRDNQTDPLIITPQNASLLLNYFWALGLGNKNEILEKGKMMDPGYGGAGNFASTGGWTIAKGNAMNHYSMHQFFTLTRKQQNLVTKVSANIYRPCCGNSTYFPDCNHGMAMLGFLELMASQGATESEMYKSALVLNSYWFPNTYLAIAEYMKQKRGINWGDVNPKEVLGADYSSGAGYQKIALQVIRPTEKQNGGGCGV